MELLLDRKRVGTNCLATVERNTEGSHVRSAAPTSGGTDRGCVVVLQCPRWERVVLAANDDIKGTWIMPITTQGIIHHPSFTTQHHQPLSTTNHSTPPTTQHHQPLITTNLSAPPTTQHHQPLSTTNHSAPPTTVPLVPSITNQQSPFNND
jgi:hypothetical protein